MAIAAIEQVSTRKANTQVEFFFEEFAESTINFVVRFWIPFVAKQADYLRARSEAIERLKQAFDENGISMPSPIRTIEFVNPVPAAAQPPAAQAAPGRRGASPGASLMPIEAFVAPNRNGRFAGGRHNKDFTAWQLRRGLPPQHLPTPFLLRPRHPPRRRPKPARPGPAAASSEPWGWG